MPQGLRRFHHTGQSHFITFTCYHRLPKLDTGQSRDLAVAALEHARVKYGFLVYAFVVMPEHVHLLISEPDRASVAEAIQSFKISSAKQVEKLRGGSEQNGRLWQIRGYDRNVRDAKEFMEKRRYIHSNSVRRGLCARPEDWKWSSFRHYLTGEDCGAEIESEWTARKREPPRVKIKPKP